jgi:hypothetical protein
MAATQTPEGIDAIPDEVFENTLWETIALLQDHVQDDRELVAAVISLLAYRVPDEGMPEAY